MALQTIKGGGLLLPHGLGSLAPNLVGTGGRLIDAVDEKAAVIFQVPKTGTIDRVGFLVRAVTTAETLRVGLETVSAADGHPTGTQYGSSVVGTQAAPAANTFYEVTLATGATATAGDIIAAVVQFDVTVGNLNIGDWERLGQGNASGLPYIDHFVTAWTKVGTSVPGLSIRYSDGTYEFVGCMPTGIRNDLSFNSGSTPDERGVYFTLPGPVRATGIYMVMGGNAAGSDHSIVLYDGDGTTALRTIALDSDQRASTNGECWLRFSTPVSLLKDTFYRLVYKPTTVNNINIREVSVLSANMMDGLPGGTQWYKTSRVDAGAWTQDALTRVWGLGLLIDQIDDAAGASGGLLTHPGMGGGARG